ncbi:UPF0280 family protein [Proteinivorax hydrogeniformans]|uniref:UPF0280 family protein n=1 Tax=Proteinivorax hydrogeniformans TaxID=1826727 RepID=A0AAU8HUH2_9FIRM
MIEKLKDDRVYVEQGPIRMVLDLSIDNKKKPNLALEVAEHVLGQFHKTLNYIPYVKGQKKLEAPIEEAPIALQKMLKAVEKCSDSFMTPLSAVAGSFSDIALEKALELGCQRIIVNNGGDIALTDVDNPINVGIPLKGNNEPSYIVTIAPKANIRGVCTSGLGGRSFSKGIADLAVTLASDAATADVSATLVANSTDVNSPNIVRCYADEIDSETDIAGQLVTLKANNLQEDEKLKALMNGCDVAEKLLNKQVIQGVFIAVGKHMVKIPNEIDIKAI